MAPDPRRRPRQLQADELGSRSGAAVGTAGPSRLRKTHAFPNPRVRASRAHTPAPRSGQGRQPPGAEAPALRRRGPEEPPGSSPRAQRTAAADVRIPRTTKADTGTGRRTQPMRPAADESGDGPSRRHEAGTTPISRPPRPRLEARVGRTQLVGTARHVRYPVMPRSRVSELVRIPRNGHPRDRVPRSTPAHASAALLTHTSWPARRCDSARPAVQPAAARFAPLPNSQLRMRLSLSGSLTTSG